MNLKGKKPVFAFYKLYFFRKIRYDIQVKKAIEGNLYGETTG